MPETNKKTMVWRNLLKYQCPECFAQLEEQHGAGRHKCTVCAFKIGIEKFESMVDSMRKQRSQKFNNQSEEDNLSRLNNL